MNIIYIACAIFILIGLKFLSSFLVYLILSIFLTILIYPVVAFFEKRGFPIFVGYIFSAILVFIIFGSMLMIVDSSLKEFINNASFYHHKFNLAFEELNRYLKKFNLKIDFSIINSIDFVQIIKLFLAKASSLVSGFLVVFIGVSFMIFESKNFGKKIELITNNKEMLKIFFKNTQKYYLIKTLMSALTGLLVTIMLLYFNIPYAYLFGIMAFLFNYIPVIGSIVAAIPGIFMSFVTYDINTAIYVTIGYLIINNLISNVLEPKFLGDGLDLSPAVVFFSLLLWGWVFGIVGMFLAAPLTMTLKLALMSNQKTKWIALLLSK